MRFEDIARNGAGRTLADFSGPDLILPSMRGRDLPACINELTHLLQAQGWVRSVLPFYQVALNQELLSSSALASGLAVPHARVSGLAEVRFAFGRISEPITWGVKGGGLVDLVFLLAVPSTDAASHLHILAGLARLASDPEAVARLRHAGTLQDIWDIFQTTRLRNAAAVLTEK